MNKKLIRLTESDLHRIVKESVNKMLNEIGDTNRGQAALGYLSGRRNNDDAWDVAWNKHDTRNEKGQRVAHPSFYSAYKKGTADRENSYPPIVREIAYYPYFGFVDFDEDYWDLPNNWDEMDRLDKAKFVYDNCEWTDEEWEEYLGTAHP